MNQQSPVIRILLNEILSLVFNFILTATLVDALYLHLVAKYPDDYDFANSNSQYFIAIIVMGISDLFLVCLLWCCGCLNFSFYHDHWITNIFKIIGFLLIINDHFDQYKALIQLQIFILFPLGGVVTSILVEFLTKFCPNLSPVDYQELPEYEV